MEQSSFAYSASSAADGAVSTTAVPELGDADADELGEAVGVAEVEADVEPGPALAAARANPAGSAWTAGAWPGTPSAFGLDDGADGAGVADGDADVDADVDGVVDGLGVAGADDVVIGKANTGQDSHCIVKNFQQAA